MRVACGAMLAPLASAIEDLQPPDTRRIVFTTLEMGDVNEIFVEKMSRFRPDIILFDPKGIPMVPLVRQLCRRADIPNARLVIGANRCDNLLKVKCLHHDLFDLIDASLGPAHVAAHLHDIHAGISRLENDDLWHLIEKPRSLADMSRVPDDHFDVAILELIRIGLNDSDIGKVVFLSTQTVRNRVSAMLQRARLVNRTQLGWSYTNHVIMNSDWIPRDWSPLEPRKDG